MANTFAPVGFRDTVLYGGAAPNYAVSSALIAYNYGTKIGMGDPVKLVSGQLNVMPAGDSNTIYGIFWGCEYYDPSLQQYVWRPYWPAPGTLASTAVVKAKVIVDRNFEFAVQVNGGPATAANIGQNFDITSSSSGAPGNNGLSTCSCSGTFATTSTLPFTVTGIVPSGSYTNFGNLQAGVPATYDSTQANNWVTCLMNKKSGVGML